MPRRRTTIATDSDGAAAAGPNRGSASVAASAKATRLVLAIDPGPTESGYVVFDGQRVLRHRCGVLPNHELVQFVRHATEDHLAIEMVASFGMAVGRDVFETVRWVGRFQQAWRNPDAVQLVYRGDVKMALCNSMRAKDANVRAALLDRFGGKAVAVGRKAAPGPLYGVKGDAWSALAVAVTAMNGGGQ